eukprot:3192793-Alexandrium_andersonii.AAC.1
MAIAGTIPCPQHHQQHQHIHQNQHQHHQPPDDPGRFLLPETTAQNGHLQTSWDRVMIVAGVHDRRHHAHVDQTFATDLRLTLSD